jgi:hypothetical protein
MVHGPPSSTQNHMEPPSQLSNLLKAVTDSLKAFIGTRHHPTPTSPLQPAQGRDRERSYSRHWETSSQTYVKESMRHLLSQLSNKHTAVVDHDEQPASNSFNHGRDGQLKGLNGTRWSLRRSQNSHARTGTAPQNPLPLPHAASRDGPSTAVGHQVHRTIRNLLSQLSNLLKAETDSLKASTGRDGAYDDPRTPMQELEPRLRTHSPCPMQQAEIGLQRQ